MTKEELYRQTDGGLDVFKYYIPNLPSNLKKKFKLREDENTPSTALKADHEGIYTIMDFGGFKKPKNCVDFVGWNFGLDFKGALDRICQDMNLSERRQSKVETPMPISKQNLTDLTDKMLAYMEGRGLSQFVLRQEKIGCQVGKYMAMAGGKIDVISIPYFDQDGEIVNYKHRGFFVKEGVTKRAFQQEKGAKQIFYGINTVTKETKVVVFVEGEIDRISIIEAFLDHENKNELAVLSVPNGAKSLSQIKTCWDAIKDIERFVLFVDDDTPGKELKDELVRRLGSAKCQVVADRPADCKDANDVLKKHGKEEVIRLVLESDFVQVEGLFQFKDFYEDADYLFEHGLNTGVTFDHLPLLSGFVSFDRGQLITVTGIPGHGKSTWLNDVLVNLAREGWSTAIFSPEVSHAKFQLRNLSENYAGKVWPSSKQAKIEANRDLVMNRQEYEQTKMFINDHFHWVEPSDYDIDSVLEVCAASVFRHGVNAIVLDPFNRIGKSKGFKGDKLEQINETLTKINRFKREYNVLVFLVAHPTKMAQNRLFKADIGTEQEREVRIWDTPNLYNIAHSSDFYNQTDIGITVYRNDESKKVEIHVLKMKMEDYGHVGTAYLNFHPITRRYTEDGITQPPMIGQTAKQQELKRSEILGPGSVSFFEDEDEIPF